MMLRALRFIIPVVALCMPIMVVQAQPFTPPVTQDAVLAYVEKIIALQQDITRLEPFPNSAREAILAETLRQNAVNVSKFGFDFARSQAVVLDTQTGQADANDANKPTTQSELDKFADTVSTRIASLQNQLSQVNRQIAQTPTRRRGALLSKKENITGELNLAKAQQDLITTIGQTVKSTSDAETTSGFTKKIDNLSRSLVALTPQAPAADTDKTAADPAPVAEKPAEDDKSDNRGGLVALGTDLFHLWKRQAQMRALKQEINDLRTDTKDIRAQVRTTLQNTAKSGNDLAQEAIAQKTLAEQRADFDNLVTNFKQLSASIPPLSQTSFWLDTTKQSLKDWQNVSDELFQLTAREFAWHLVLLGIAILIPVVLSEVARRMTVRYVKDTRRLRQLRLLRRVVFTFVIALIIMLNLATEFGSLATFAGFLTAGIAVALQNIILSLVAHFFFFGRYGVRTGDRVTVGGVTGDVTQIGMVRLYLMEIEGSGDETRPSGRIVAFPNSILFQPTAFFKHVTS